MRCSAVCFFLLPALLISQGLADDIQEKIPKNATGIQAIEGRIGKVTALCPADVVCITDGTVIDLSFEIKPCTEAMGPVYSLETVDEKNRKAEIVITALKYNLAPPKKGKQSAPKQCGKTVKVEKSLSIIGPVLKREEISIHFITKTTSP